METVILKNHHCKRCNGDWHSRLEAPKYCPMCKSPYWNRDRIARLPKEKRVIERAYETEIGGTIKIPFYDHKANWDMQEYLGAFPAGEQRRGMNGAIWTKAVENGYTTFTRLG